jgi:release factor glutamine methyltransferase
MKVRETLSTASARLGGTSDTPRLDAELLMAQALGLSREAMLLGDLEGPAPAAFDALLARRLAHEPIAYITGRRAFWTIELDVGPGALIPRPDSETLIEAALAHFGDSGPATILDLGTGPGTLLLAALDQWPAARGLGVDRSDAALAYAWRNGERLGLAARAEWRLGDWDAGIAERFDLVLSNPPYVEAGAVLAPDVADHEPAGALYAGADGLDACRALAPRIGRLIAPGGIACVEIGAGQADAAAALFAAHRLSVTPRRDLGGIARCLVLTNLEE